MAHRVVRLGKINLVVGDLDESLAFWTSVFQARPLRRRGGGTIGKVAGDRGDFFGASIELGGFVVDLAQPDDPDGVLAGVLATRGEGFLSLCLEVEDFWDSADWFAEHGLDVVNRVTMMGNKIGFIPAEQCHGVLVEIIERPAWWTREDSALDGAALAQVQALIADGQNVLRPLLR
jgi:catechol 2,3-dioxygenase-like lactoylglutathione lyase family enzyme